MSRKIEPTISAWFKDPPTGREYPGYDVARRELRALLAVARAAELALVAEAECAGTTGGIDGILDDPTSFLPADVRLARALSRLSRVSRRGKGR